MSPLTWLSPGRWLLALGLLLSLWLGYHAWAEHQQGIGYQRAVDAYAKQAQDTDKFRAALAAPIEAAHQAKDAAIVTVTKTIIKDRYVYVKDTDCALPGGFRVLHDAAAHGVVPQPAAIADAAAAPAADVADTVATNYGTCHQIAERLTALQAWVSAQQALSK